MSRALIVSITELTAWPPRRAGSGGFVVPQVFNTEDVEDHGDHGEGDTTDRSIPSLGRRRHCFLPSWPSVVLHVLRVKPSRNDTRPEPPRGGRRRPGNRALPAARAAAGSGSEHARPEAPRRHRPSGQREFSPSPRLPVARTSRPHQARARRKPITPPAPPRSSPAARWPTGRGRSPRCGFPPAPPAAAAPAGAARDARRGWRPGPRPRPAARFP